jgi:hypothetical protein
MPDATIPYKNSLLSKLFFVLSIVIFVFWFLGQRIDVYRFAIVGAIYEILWLFMVLMLFVLPVISLVFVVKEKFNFRSFYLYCFLISAVNILLMFVLS